MAFISPLFNASFIIISVLFTISTHIFFSQYNKNKVWSNSINAFLRFDYRKPM